MSKKSNKDLSATSRKGVVLIVMLAVMILLVNLVTFSYSWFQPQSVGGKGVVFQYNTAIRSEECLYSTYRGEVVTAEMKSGNPDAYKGFYIDEVKYSDAEIKTQEDGVVSVPAKGRAYFRTNIENQSQVYPSVVSLYTKTMPANLNVDVTFPSNSVRSVGSENKTDYYIIRNAYVKKKDLNDADGPGLLQVDWFVENTGNTPVSIDLKNLYLMYN